MACKPHAEQMQQQLLDKGSVSLFLSAMLGLEELSEGVSQTLDCECE